MFQATQLLRSVTFQDTLTFLQVMLSYQKVRHNIKRYVFNSESSYAYVLRYAAMFTLKDTQLCLRSKICFCSKKYGYVPSYAATQLHLHSKMRLRFFKLRYTIKVDSKGTLSIPSQATLKFQDTQLRLSSKIPSYVTLQDMLTFQKTWLRSIYAATQLHIHSKIHFSFQS